MLNTQEIRDRAFGTVNLNTFLFSDIYELCNEVDRLRKAEQRFEIVCKRNDDLITENEKLQKNLQAERECRDNLIKLNRELEKELEASEVSRPLFVVDTGMFYKGDSVMLQTRQPERAKQCGQYLCEHFIDIWGEGKCI
jgi:uncharacterized protein YigA (DUF484 family)